MLIAELQQGPFAIFFPCPELKPSQEREVTCLPAVPRLQSSGRDGMHGRDGAGVSLAPLY